MEVILLERVSKLGHMGQTVRVKDGYARNYLLPRGKALRATAENMKRFEAQKSVLEKRNNERKADAEKIGSKLNGKSFVIVRQAGETGQLYGSVAARDIADLINAEGHSISRSQIVLNQPIKNLGLHSVGVHLHGDVDAEITVNVARSTDEAERQARGENVLARKDDDDVPAAVAAEVVDNSAEADAE